MMPYMVVPVATKTITMAETMVAMVAIVLGVEDMEEAAEATVVVEEGVVAEVGVVVAEMGECLYT